MLKVGGRAGSAVLQDSIRSPALNVKLNRALSYKHFVPMARSASDVDTGFSARALRRRRPTPHLARAIPAYSNYESRKFQCQAGALRLRHKSSDLSRSHLFASGF